jgi:protein TonB
MASNRPPTYPESARRRGIQGRVLVRVSVSTDGTPLAVSVDESSGAASLDDAAVAAVQKWRFVPANQGSKPIPGTAEVPIVFRLQQ